MTRAEADDLLHQWWYEVRGSLASQQKRARIVDAMVGASLSRQGEGDVVLADIGDALQAQDNRATALPIFVVQRRKRTYGFDPDYTDDCIAWLYADEAVEVPADEAAALAAKYDETGDEPEGFIRTAYVDSWEFVQPFFTEKAAQRYIDENKHNLAPEARIYVESGYRNHEWDAIRRACIAASRLRASTPAPLLEGPRAKALRLKMFEMRDAREVTSPAGFTLTVEAKAKLYDIQQDIIRAAIAADDNAIAAHLGSAPRRPGGGGGESLGTLPTSPPTEEKKP